MTLEENIDAWVAQLESDSEGRVICPRENRKNVYTKTCWLLSKYQWMRKCVVQSPKFDSAALYHVDKQIKTLKEFLPICLEYLKEIAP